MFKGVSPEGETHRGVLGQKEANVTVEAEGRFLTLSKEKKDN